MSYVMNGSQSPSFLLLLKIWSMNLQYWKGKVPLPLFTNGIFSVFRLWNSVKCSYSFIHQKLFVCSKVTQFPLFTHLPSPISYLLKLTLFLKKYHMMHVFHIQTYVYIYDITNPIIIHFYTKTWNMNWDLR